MCPAAADFCKDSSGGCLFPAGRTAALGSHHVLSERSLSESCRAVFSGVVPGVLEKITRSRHLADISFLILLLYTTAKKPSSNNRRKMASLFIMKYSITEPCTVSCYRRSSPGSGTAYQQRRYERPCRSTYPCKADEPS